MIYLKSVFLLLVNPLGAELTLLLYTGGGITQLVCHPPLYTEDPGLNPDGSLTQVTNKRGRDCLL